MKYISLAQSDLTISKIAFGCGPLGGSDWGKFNEKETMSAVSKAYELGINFFDTANAYSLGRSEEITGELLKERRGEVVLTSKVWSPMGDGPNERGLSRVHIHQQIEESLNRLQTNYVDLYQVHRWDNNTPIEETLKTLDSLISDGRVRYIGASSMYAWQFMKALWTSDVLGLERFESMQNYYNLCYREEEREMIPLCHDQGIGILNWAPLAGGFLTGQLKRGIEPNTAYSKISPKWHEQYTKVANFDIIERVEEIAKEKDATPSQISLSWLLAKGVTAPIVGATTIEHVEDVVDSLNITLSENDISYLEEPYKPQTIVGHC